ARPRHARSRPQHRGRRRGTAGPCDGLASGGASVSRRTASRVAWSTGGASIGMAAAGLALAASGRGGPLGDSLAFFALVLPLVLAASVVGALVAARQPANP